MNKINKRSIGFILFILITAIPFAAGAYEGSFDPLEVGKDALPYNPDSSERFIPLVVYAAMLLYGLYHIGCGVWFLGGRFSRFARKIFGMFLVAAAFLLFSSGVEAKVDCLWSNWGECPKGQECAWDPEFRIHHCMGKEELDELKKPSKSPQKETAVPSPKKEENKKDKKTSSQKTRLPRDCFTSEIPHKPLPFCKTKKKAAVKKSRPEKTAPAKTRVFAPRGCRYPL